MHNAIYLLATFLKIISQKQRQARIILAEGMHRKSRHCNGIKGQVDVSMAGNVRNTLCRVKKKYVMRSHVCNLIRVLLLQKYHVLCVCRGRSNVVDRAYKLCNDLQLHDMRLCKSTVRWFIRNE